MTVNPLKRMIATAALVIAPGAAATLEVAEPCSAVFPKAAAAIIAAGYQPTVSDSSGGLLTGRFAGEPMVYQFMVKHAGPFVAKYAENGDRLRKKFRGLTFTDAAFTFAANGAGCRVNLKIGLAGLDITPKRDQSGRMGWVRVATPLTSNGTAETEMFAAITGAK
jgi:hypothetical protein